MKNKQQSIFKSQIVALAVLTIFAFFAISSCTKSSSGSDGAQFVGTWNGTSSCGGSASFVLTASGNTVSTTGTVGATGCVKSITFSGTASGSNVVFPAQTYVDGCGNSYTITGAGSISGGTLTLTESVTGIVNASCTFTGTK